MPIHSHHGTERLKPERIAQPRQEDGGAVVPDDGFADRRAQFGHALGKPLGDAAAVKRKICDSGALHAVMIPKYLPHPSMIRFNPDSGSSEEQTWSSEGTRQ